MNKTNMMIVVGAVVLLLIGGGFLLLNKPQPTSGSQEVPQESTVVEVTKEATSSSPSLAMEKEASVEGAMIKGETKEFKVEGSNFKFSLSEIKVKKGDTVKITFTNKDGFHDWVLDEFKAKTAQIAAGKSETVQFTADKVGTFEYYCSVGQHRKNGMKGSLIVE